MLLHAVVTDPKQSIEKCLHQVAARVPYEDFHHERADRCVGIGAIKMTRDRVNWGGAAPMQLREGLHNWLQREAATDVLSGLAFPPSFWFWSIVDVYITELVCSVAF